LPSILVSQSIGSTLGLCIDIILFAEQTTPSILVYPTSNFMNLDLDIPKPIPSLLAFPIIKS